jgi:lysophospholipase L1-like esterase
MKPDDRHRRNGRATLPAPWTASLWTVALCGVALWAAVPAAVGAQPIYVAFGDSITAGVNFDEECACQCPEECGYPLRLQERLRAVGEDVTVVNHGLGGETTPLGVTRMDEVLELEPNADVLLLMEGTNDISRGISRETTLFNLSRMAEKAEMAGLEAIHATLIPRYPEAAEDADNAVNETLARGIRELAFEDGRRLAEPFDLFINTPDVFDTHYAVMPGDLVGHPNSFGYERLTQVFFDMLRDRDVVPPVVGRVEPAVGAEEVSPFAPIRFVLYDFGFGVNLGATHLLVDGVEVPYTATGFPRAYEITYLPPQALPETVTVTVQSRDRRSPANTMTDEVTRFTVAEIMASPCVPDETTLCIDHHPGDGRFKVTMTWHTALNGGQAGTAFATPLTDVGLDAGGLMSFFDGNPEVLIKVLNGCGSNDHFWLFASATTTLGFVLTVEDTVAHMRGAPPSVYEVSLVNDDGDFAQPRFDIEAFPTCIYNQP